jgi:hypothetical protein
MTFTKAILALACLMSSTLVAQEAKVTELLSKDLTNCPGKEGLMISVEYPPGSSVVLPDAALPSREVKF